MADTDFLKSDFLWKLKFYHWQQVLSSVYLDMIGSLHSFSRKCLPPTHIRKITVCYSLRLNCVLWKQQLVLLTKQSHKSFSWDKRCVSSRKSPVHILPFSIQNVKETCTWGQDLIKCNLNRQIMDILQQNWHYFTLSTGWSKMQWLISTIDAPALIPAKELSLLHCCTNIDAMNKANNILVLPWK